MPAAKRRIHTIPDPPAPQPPKPPIQPVRQTPVAPPPPPLADERLKPGFDKTRLHNHDGVYGEYGATCCWCNAPLLSIRNRTAWRCPMIACFKRQMKYAVSTHKAKNGNITVNTGDEVGKHSEERLIFLPLPIQVVFFEAVLNQKHLYVLFGGAAGGSKSHALRWLAHYLCITKKDFKVLILRRKYTQLEESHLTRVKGEALALGADFIKMDKVVNYKTGSRLKFGHCENRGDEENYQGDEFDLLLFDEETHFEESMITFISSRTRTSRTDGWMPVVAGGTNPGGVGAEYCLSHFITFEVDHEKYPSYDPSEYLYIPAKLTNNPYLDRFYVRKLLNMTKQRRQQMLDGNWYAFEGMFFEEWRPTDETCANGVVLRAHTADLTYGPEYDRFCSMDWGYSDKGVVLWWVCLSDGKLYVEDEFVFRQMNIPDVCTEILRRTKDRKLRVVKYTVASPDLFPQTGQTGESRAETFRRHKVPVRKANNSRVQGWQRMRELFRAGSDGYANVRINPRTCPYLCRTIPQLVGDRDNPEDISQHKDDHAAESMRYGAMSRPAPTRFPTARMVIPGTGGALTAAVLAAMDDAA